MIDSSLALGATLVGVIRFDDRRVQPLRIFRFHDPELRRTEALVVAGLAEHVVAV
jgi:hypothetical protein